MTVLEFRSGIPGGCAVNQAYACQAGLRSSPIVCGPQEPLTPNLHLGWQLIHMHRQAGSNGGVCLLGEFIS